MDVNIYGHTLTENGKVYIDGVELRYKENRFGAIEVFLNNRTYKLERLIAEAVFKLSEYDMLFLEFSHINLFKGDNSFCNIKIYNKKDKKNKSGLSVSLHNGKPYVFNYRNPVEPCINILEALKV